MKYLCMQKTAAASPYRRDEQKTDEDQRTLMGGENVQNEREQLLRLIAKIPLKLSFVAVAERLTRMLCMRRI